MLSEIIADVRRRLPDLQGSAAALRAAAEEMAPARDFEGALRSPGLSVIAEIKRASPSRGILDADLDPAALAAEYVAGGAAAVSVLTEPDHFLGSLDDLQAVRASVSVPVLRKDFVIDPVQVWEARAANADALLLIAAVLDDPAFRDLLAETTRAGMAALVEVHTAAEAERALAAGARIIGVNNRDLRTFDVDLAVAEAIAPRLYGLATLVAESGIWTAADASRMVDAGFDAVLVGESLVRAPDAAGLLASLRGIG